MPLDLNVKQHTEFLWKHQSFKEVSHFQRGLVFTTGTPHPSESV